MSFFFAGKSVCPICMRVMERIEDTAFLDYASQEEVGDVAVRGRHRVHRECWTKWDQRARWAASAFGLKSSVENVVEGELLILRQRGAYVAITDFWLGIEIEVPADELKPFFLAMCNGENFEWWSQGDNWQFLQFEGGFAIRVKSKYPRPDVAALESDKQRWCTALHHYLQTTMH